MTREELVGIMERQWVLPQFTDDCFKNIADNLLAALAKEREGEVVLVKGEITKATIPGYYHLAGMYAFRSAELESHVGKRGQLIFRPAKGGE